jgi:diguanylate cyclase (GGDEF)-like protein/PAS domain S-box-containing protein
MNMPAPRALISSNVLPLLSSLADYKILSALPLASAIFDRSGHCTYLNPAGQLLIGQSGICPEQTPFYQLKGIKGKTSEPYPPEQLPFVQALQEGTTVTKRDVVFFRQALPIVLEMQAIPLISRKSRESMIIVLLKEITDPEQDVQTLAKTEYFYRRLAENMPGSFQYVMHPDRQGHLTYVSPSFDKFYSIESSWLLADPDNFWKIVAPDQVQTMQDEILRSYETLTPWVHQGILVTPRGQQHFQCYATPEKQTNGNVIWHGFIVDITDHKNADIERQSSESQLKYLSKSFVGVPFRYVLNEDGHYGFADIDEQIEQIYGVERQLLINNPEALESIAHPDDRHALQAVINQTLANPESFNLEYRIITPQGTIKWTKVVAQHEQQLNGQHVWYGMILDITERKQVEKILADYNESLEKEVHERTLELELEVQERKRAEEKARRAEAALRQANVKLELLATLDGLTQIANRRRFDEFLNQTWRLMMRDGQKMSVILCDVDYFKRYNDTYGHQAGDACLQQIADVLQKTANRAGDLVARYGGEEFAIILGSTDELGARSLCYNIRWAIAELNIPHSASDVNSHVTLSIGICTMVPSLQVLPESLVAMADKALYKAKHLGRNRVVHSSDYIVD